MAKHGSGLFTLIVGVVAGAAAVLLSDSGNRKKAEHELQKVSTKTKKLAKAIEKDPEKVAKQVIRRGKKVAAVAVGQATVTPKAPKKKTSRRSA